MNYRVTFNSIAFIERSTIAVILVMCSIALHPAEVGALFDPVVNYGAGDEPASIAIGDFNKDSNLDLAVANNLSDNVSVLLGKSDGSFQVGGKYQHPTITLSNTT